MSCQLNLSSRNDSTINYFTLSRNEQLTVQSLIHVEVLQEEKNVKSKICAHLNGLDQTDPERSAVINRGILEFDQLIKNAQYKITSYDFFEYYKEVFLIEHLNYFTLIGDPHSAMYVVQSAKWNSVVMRVINQVEEKMKTYFDNGGMNTENFKELNTFAYGEIYNEKLQIINQRSNGQLQFERQFTEVMEKHLQIRTWLSSKKPFECVDLFMNLSLQDPIMEWKSLIILAEKEMKAEQEKKDSALKALEMQHKIKEANRLRELLLKELEEVSTPSKKKAVSKSQITPAAKPIAQSKQEKKIQEESLPRMRPMGVRTISKQEAQSFIMVSPLKSQAKQKPFIQSTIKSWQDYIESSQKPFIMNSWVRRWNVGSVEEVKKFISHADHKISYSNMKIGQLSTQIKAHFCPRYFLKLLAFSEFRQNYLSQTSKGLLIKAKLLGQPWTLLTLGIDPNGELFHFYLLPNEQLHIVDNHDPGEILFKEYFAQQAASEKSFENSEIQAEEITFHSIEHEHPLIKIDYNLPANLGRTSLFLAPLKVSIGTIRKDLVN